MAGSLTQCLDDRLYGVLTQLPPCKEFYALDVNRHDLSRMLHRRRLCSSKKRGVTVGTIKLGKGTKRMVIADASGLPLAVYTDSANPHELTLVQATINEVATVGQPKRIVGDRAYDSDPLDKTLAAQGIERIVHHTGETDNAKQRRMSASCNDIADVGKLNAFSHGLMHLNER
jgi:hypothetical protein